MWGRSHLQSHEYLQFPDSDVPWRINHLLIKPITTYDPAWLQPADCTSNIRLTKPI